MADELGMMSQKGTSTREKGEKGEKGEKDQGQEKNHSSSTIFTAETLLRAAPVGLCVAALAVMLKNSQNNDFGDLSYSDLGAFQYVFRCSLLFSTYNFGTEGSCLIS
jgi:Domain of unknown function (DUF588)